MKAKALICDENQAFSLEEVTLSEPTADQLVVKTAYSGVSIGTEFALIRNKISWGPYPLITGYMSTGVVETVGQSVTGFAVGDKVYCRQNEATVTRMDGSKVSNVCGTHASHIMLTPNTSHGAGLVGEASMETASMFVMPAVGLNGVDMANPRLGEVVVVYGAGLIGQGVIAAAAHRGCVVVAVDISERQLELAKAMGADDTINSSSQNVAETLKGILGGGRDGADLVFECTGIPACIGAAMELCRVKGRFVWQGNYGEAPLEFSFIPAHIRQLTTFMPCDDGLMPCRRAVVKNMASGALPWEKLITHRVAAEASPELFTAINSGKGKDIVGAVICWD